MQSSKMNAFEGLWEDLFTTPVHLDSALSKLKPQNKAALARIVPQILLRPVSLADSMGIGVAPGEPWSLTRQEMLSWRPAKLMAERLTQKGAGEIPAPAPLEEDFPPSMVAEWKREWGEEISRRLVEVLAMPARLTLRASSQFGAERLVQDLMSGSKLPVKASRSQNSPVGVLLSGYAPVLATELFESGAFEIQDEGSQVMALFALWPEVFGKGLQRSPGQPMEAMRITELPELSKPPIVVDACAGAGGKSLALADALRGKGRVFSYDISDRKLQALRRRAKRAGLSNIQTLALREGAESEAIRPYAGKADLVLVDAPCSGWGVIRRNPDAKWRQTPEELHRLPELQLRLLREYSALVKPGGTLVFGVCTFRKAETTGIVEAFLESHPQFKPGQGGYYGPGPSSDGFFMQAMTHA